MDKTILITGANHGLGLSLTKTFLDNGFTVFAGAYKLNGDSQINAIKTAENLYIVDMDISDMDTVKQAACFIRDITPSLDIIINNAGIMSYDENNNIMKSIFEELDFESINEIINVNAVGALRVVNVFAPLLKNGSDRLVVNISSEAGSISDCERNGWFGYCMSKAALNMAGALIHNELKKYGGQVFQIHPGYMQTYMNGAKNESATYTPDFSAENICKLILNRQRYKSSKAVFMDLFGNKIDW